MCAGCNRRHNVDPEPYLTYMLGRYGPEVVAELGGLRTNLRKVADGELWRLLGELRGPDAAPAQ